MPRGKVVALVLVVLVVVGLAAGYVLDPDGRLKGWLNSEPFFADRSLSAWAADLRSPEENDRALAAERLKSGGTDAVPVLTALLSIPGNPEPRWRAADVLGQMGPAAKPAGPALVVALGDPDPLVPGVAAKAIAKLAPDVPGAVPALVKQFPDIEALRAVAAFKAAGAEAIPALRPLFDHSDVTVRRQAIRAVGKIGLPSLPLLPDLIALTKDNVPGVREQAAEACGDIGPQAAAAVPALIAVLKDPDWKVRRDAVRALGQMKAAATAAKAEVTALKNNDPEPEVKVAAERALRQLEDTDLTGTRRPDGR